MHLAFLVIIFKSFVICGHPTCQHGLVHGVGLWVCGNGYGGSKDQVCENILFGKFSFPAQLENHSDTPLRRNLLADTVLP